mmetsp:Transcript_4995/g.9656  ORF Transcript_4995/g.9656 Transcript_4995/m.9656 type:complete len:369 (-) Transcript_4995:254-1360(-)
MLASRILVPGELRTTKTLCLVLLIFWILGLTVPSTEAWLALVPGYTIQSTPRIWALVTAGFYETSVVMGLANLSALVLVGPVLEDSWGSSSFKKFVLFVNISTFVVVFFGAVFLYIFSANARYLFLPMCGFSPVNAGFVVALFQMFPTKPLLPVSPVPAIRHLPILVVTGSVMLYVGGVVNGKEAPLVVFGTLFGWVFLRFLRTDDQTGLVGDLRPEFAFAQLFPDVPVLRPVLVFCSALCYKAVLAAGCFTASANSHKLGPSRSAAASSSSSSASLSSSSSQQRTIDDSERVGGRNTEFSFGTSDATADRRRALAIRAIDEKLAQLNQTGELDNDDDNLEIDLDDADLDPELPILGSGSTAIDIAPQ